jgi:DNA-binding HxlR family transcriptional regulator
MSGRGLIGSKWVSSILEALMERKKMRFSEIMRSLGITDKVLSEKLSGLLEQGLVTREVKEDRSTTYSLTGKGRKLAVKLAELDEILKGEVQVPSRVEKIRRS